MYGTPCGRVKAHVAGLKRIDWTPCGRARLRCPIGTTAVSTAENNSTGRGICPQPICLVPRSICRAPYAWLHTPYAWLYDSIPHAVLLIFRHGPNVDTLKLHPSSVNFAIYGAPQDKVLDQTHFPKLHYTGSSSKPQVAKNKRHGAEGAIYG